MGRFTMHWSIFSLFFCLVQIQLSLAGENGTRSNLRTKDENLFKITRTLASVREFPNEIHKCTASFISSKFLVTTARCLYCENECKLFIRTSSHHLLDTRGDNNGMTYDVRQTILHPHYDRYPQKNDIGLIELTTEVATASFLHLPENLDVDRQYNGQIYSWEFSQDKREFSLRNYHVMTISNAMCSLIFNQYIDCQHVCAKRDTPFSFGSGDQGTPLTINHQGKMYMYGYYGREGLKWPMKTEIFQLISPFIMWIKKYVKNSSPPEPRPEPSQISSQRPRPVPSPEPRPISLAGPRPIPSPGPRPIPSPGPRPMPSPEPRPIPAPGPKPAASRLAPISGAKPPSLQRLGLISNPTLKTTTPSVPIKNSKKKKQVKPSPQKQGYNKPMKLYTIDEDDDQPKTYEENQFYYQTVNEYDKNTNQLYQQYGDYQEYENGNSQDYPQSKDYQDYGNENDNEYPNPIYQQNQDYYQNWNGNNGKPGKASPQNQEPYQNWNGYPNQGYPQNQDYQEYGNGNNKGKPNRVYPTWSENQSSNEEEDSAYSNDYFLRNFLGLEDANKEIESPGMPAPLLALLSDSFDKNDTAEVKDNSPGTP